MQRSLGYSLFLKDTSLLGLLKSKKQILSTLNQHAVICIKNVDFQAKQMYEFTKGMWREIVKLPKVMALNNIDPVYNEVGRIGNMNADETLKQDAQKEAAYWHQDGDFWGEKNKHLFQVLHPRVLPTSGGSTHFIDLVQGAKLFKIKRPQIYQKLKTMYGTVDLQSIGAFKQYNVKNELGIQTISKHQILKPFGENQQILFLSVHQLNEKNTGQVSKDLKISQLHTILQQQLGYYDHKWQKGDLLIWDNIRTIHRACGYFTGNRLLLRTQARA